MKFRHLLSPFEQEEIKQYADVYFVGTKEAKKIVGDASKPANFGYDDAEVCIGDLGCVWEGKGV